MVQDSSSIWSLPGHLAKPLAARLRRLPIAGVGLGADRLRRRSSRWLTRRVLADAVGVVVRDGSSAAALADAGVRAEVGADLVFDLAPLTARTATPRSDIVVAIGPVVRRGRITPVARRHDHGGFDAAADAIHAFSRRLASPVAVAPFRGGHDLEFGRRLVERLGDTARLLPADPVVIRTAIAGARVVLSSRYHASVLALVDATPVLVCSEEAKLATLAREIGDQDRIRVLPSWSELADAGVAGPFANGVAPGGVKSHREALTALVEAAARRRR
jgi:polysaccharide pyruvyl transferase WcaK-like protein